MFPCASLDLCHLSRLVLMNHLRCSPVTSEGARQGNNKKGKKELEAQKAGAKPQHPAHHYGWTAVSLMSRPASRPDREKQTPSHIQGWKDDSR